MRALNRVRFVRSSHLSASTVWVISVLVAICTTGCGIGPYNVEVLCEKKQGDVAIQVVSYDRYSLFPHPEIGGEDSFAGICVLEYGFLNRPRG